MKNNFLNLVWSVIGMIIIVYTFLNGQTTKTLFHVEINIWLYRGVWALISIGSLIVFLKRSKTSKN
jgi:hypothetical protein